MTTPDDTYWDHEAAQLDTLLKLLPGINPDDLGPDPQKTLTEYVFPPSYKTDELTRILQHFTTKAPREFAMVYSTLQHKRMAVARKKRRPA